MKKHPAAGAITRARRLRSQMTDAERAIWGMMRSRHIDGHRFRRQVPFGRYVADFACHESRLIIEIDGGQHNRTSIEEAKRSRFFENQGYRILRLWNNDVLNNREGVWSAIAAELQRHHPFPTLPHQGGGLSVAWHRFDEFSVAQLYELLRFRQAIFVVEQASPYPDLDGRDQAAEHLLLHIDGAPAGCLRLIPYPADKQVAIGRVAVAPDWRRRGLARLMMEEALARVRRDHGDCAVTLGAQTYLVPFYESLGFSATTSPYDDYGVPHVDMVLLPR